MNGCPYKSKLKANVVRHEKVCEVKLRTLPQTASPFTREELGEIYGDTHCSQSDFNTIIKAISKRLGKHWFPKNIHKAAAEYANAMGTHFKTEVVEFQDNRGNPIQRTLSIPEDTDDFLDVINVGRGGIKEERVVLSSDKGSSTFLSATLLPTILLLLSYLLF